MRAKRFLCLLMALTALLPVFSAQAASALTLTAEAQAVRYSAQLSVHFALLKYTASAESGQTVIYAPDGRFEGVIDLPYSQAGGKVTVTIESLAGKKLAESKITLSAASGYIAPQGKTSGKVTGLKLEETADGFRYSFSAQGSDYMLLKYRNRQQSATFPVWPDPETGLFSGEISLPLTYARTLTTVQVLTAKKDVKTEGEVRKGYEAPPPAEQQDGRLSGLTVCIDPGHQENGQRVKEPMGPGLSGSTTGTSGSAQGIITLRRESIVVLEISMALRDELLRQGANVVMTRETQDVFHTNIERCQIAEEGGAFIMLRIHADSRENHTKEGISIYAPLHSDYARAVASPADYRAMGELLLNAMKRSLGYELSSKTGSVNLNDNYVGNNWAKMICFLIETGYMTTPSQDYLLSTPIYQQWLAEGMAQGVYEIALFRGLIQEQ